MSGKTVTIDFEGMYKKVIHYFKTLAKDMQIAWIVMGVGLLILIIALLM